MWACDRFGWHTDMQQLGKYLDKITDSLNQKGLIPTILWICMAILRRAKRWTPVAILRRHQEENFDMHYGVVTKVGEDVDRSGIGEEQSCHCYEYQPASVVMVKKSLKNLQICYEEYVFIDLGSGKGRVLVLAAEFPFKKIIGVEIIEELHNIAEQNIRNCYLPSYAKQRIESVLMDVSNFRFPNENLVLFLFNPFSEKIIRHVIRNLYTSLQEKPRKIIVMYMNPAHASPFEESKIFSYVERRKAGICYKEY
ncbi:MAG: class I SAM-dependent methyltransferase, partial [SAR324 cluster bacterium]|nr:class I SAM-dependent methyltransferase [SAR324 cluster bacterium]